MFILCKAANAQVYTAGTVYPYYYDINPDSVLIYWVGSSHINNESYYIDINQDSQYDLRIKCSASSGVYFGAGSISVLSLNQKTLKRLKNDPTAGIKIAHPLSINDSINSLNTVWDSTELFISYDSHPVMAPPISVYSDWCTSNDLFIGVKFVDLSDTIFGWIRVNCFRSSNSGATCIVKDYSFQSIYAGIKENSLSKDLKIYPNPTGNYVNISNEPFDQEKTKIELINPIGQTVLKTEFKNQIDVSRLPGGVYTLLLKDNAGNVISKIFVKE